MTNKERLEIEIKNINLSENEKEIYLEESELDPEEEYNPSSNNNKRNILKTALSILESIANDPAAMKNYKQDDITVSQFSENLQNRIDQLERKIRQMSTTDNNNEDNFFMLFDS